MKSTVLLLLAISLGVPLSAAASAPTNNPVALAQRLETELTLLTEDAGRADAAIDTTALAKIDAEIKAGSSEWVRGGGQVEQAAKLVQLRGLLANARRYNELRQQRVPAVLPYTGLDSALAVRASTEASLGASCLNPLDLATGRALAPTLAAAGAKGDAFWVRVVASANVRTAISTLGSRGDVDIAVFAACADEQPLLVNDDFYGLQALAVLPSRSRASYLVRVGNRDESRPVPARIEAVLATGYGGKVTVEPSGTASVAGIAVANFSSTSGYYMGITTTDASGTYLMTVGPSGSYYSRTGAYPQSAIVHEAYGDVPCTNPDYYSLNSCAPGQIAPITVADNQITSGIDFALGLGRALSFRITNEIGGSPLLSASASLSWADGSYSNGYADNAGRVSFVGLRAGIAYRASFSAEGFRPEAFDNVPCASYCQPGQGTAITFQASDPYFREHIVSLAPVRKLVVHVRDLPLTSYNASVNVLYPSGQVAMSGYAYYSSIPGWRSAIINEPAPGTYYLQAGYTDASFWRLYPNVDCLSDCLSLLGQAQSIVISASTQTQEYFIEPRPFPSVSGSVVDQVSGSPVIDASAVLLPLSGGGQSATSVSSTGEYRFNYARPGSYLVAIMSPEHVDVAYPNAPCTGSSYSLVCANATPITITATPSNFDFDFSLQRSGRIGGRLTIEGAPITNTVQLRLRRVDGTDATSMLQTGTGQYSLTDITPGSYRVVAEDSDFAYGQAYPGVNCTGSACTSTTLGQLLVVGQAALSDIHFDLRLQRGGKGRVLDAITGQPLSGVVVDMWTAEPTGASYVRSGLTGSDGRFVIPARDYYWTSYRLATSAAGNYTNEVYNNVQCPFGPAYLGLCDLAQGDPLVAVHPIDSQGVTFRLMPAGSDVLFANGIED